jgi:protein TonB
VPDETPGDLVGIPDAPSFNSTPETLSLSALEFKHRVQPEYPQKALARKLSGWVDLRFLVNTQGNTENIQVMDSEPKGSFEKAATKAIAKWRFKPVMVDGMPAETYSIVRLRFSPE